MMNYVRFELPAVLLMMAVVPGLTLAQPVNFDTSLHATREGKAFWYSAENGGFEAFTGITIEQLGCQECHGPTDANGDAYTDGFKGMDCADCHQTRTNWGVTQTQCYGCHGRQKTEALALGIPDVHRDAGMVCWDCHSSGDLHGDGNEYFSMLQPGAIDADCENCHNPSERPLPQYHDLVDPHGGALHCSSCHAQTVISCYNCHFESQVESHVKRAKQPLAGFVMLANREKDDKVYPMSFQSVTYQNSAFVAFGPYSPHTITPHGRTCSECHNNVDGSNDAITQYNETGVMRFAEWDDETNTLSYLKGIVPVPEDYETSLKMDFITYDGNTSDPPGPSPNWSSIGKDTWDGHQMFFASPLDKGQMKALGFIVPEPDIAEELLDLADDIDALDLALFDAKNLKQAEGRRNALSNKLRAAAKAAGNKANGVIQQLLSLRQKLDGDPTPPDWIVDSPEKTYFLKRIDELVERC